MHHRDARDIDALLRQVAEQAAIAGPAGGAQDSPEARLDPFVSATITSPPYGALVDYGVAGQIGFGQSTEDYLTACAQVFKDVHSWTKSAGSLWLIVDNFTQPAADGRPSRLRALPFELAQLAEDVGWTLKDIIIWRKDRTLPWSHRGRLRNAFEHVLVLAKTDEFMMRTDRLRDNGDLAKWWVRYPERYHPSGKAPDNMWDIPIPVQGSWGRKEYQHACPLPPELVRRIVLLSTDPGDTVLDPFAGLGTVPAVAEALGRTGLGTELNPDFVNAFTTHLRREVTAQVAAAEGAPGGPTSATIKDLRRLKYAKTLMTRARATYPDLPTPDLAIGRLTRPSTVSCDTASRSVVSVSWDMVLLDGALGDREELQSAMKELTTIRPLSKYGVAADIRVIDEAEARRVLDHTDWHVYEHGQTWVSSRTVPGVAALELRRSVRRGRYVPIVADTHLCIDTELVGDVAADPD